MPVGYDYLFKIVLIGDCGVGKSSLLLRFIRDTYDIDIRSTIGVEFESPIIDLDGKKIKLQIWDTPGQVQFHKIITSSYKGAHGIIIVYDATELESFNNLNQWLQMINRYADGNVNKLLVGNKCNLTARKAVEYTKAKEFAESLKIPFIEVSALHSTNVKQAFMTIVASIYSRISSVQSKSSNNACITS